MFGAADSEGATWWPLIPPHRPHQQAWRMSACRALDVTVATTLGTEWTKPRGARSCAARTTSRE